MKISEDEVIQENLPNLHKYLGRIDEDDTDAQKTALAKPAVHVIPDNVDQSIIAVWVDTNLILAVTDDNPDTDDVKRVFDKLLDSLPAALNFQAIQDLATEATAAVASILKTNSKAEIITFAIPIHLTKPNCTYTATAKLYGKSLIEDDDQYEIGQAGVEVVFVSSSGKPTQAQQLHRHPSAEEGIADTYVVEATLTRPAPAGKVAGGVNAHLRVATSGATVGHAISAIHVNQIRFDIIEQCPAGSQVTAPEENPHTNPGDNPEPPG